MERVNARLKDEFGGRQIRVRWGGQSDGASDVRGAGADGGSILRLGQQIV